MSFSNTIRKIIAIAEYTGLSVGFLRNVYQRGLVPIGFFSDLDQKWLTELSINAVIDIGANVGQFTKAIQTPIRYLSGMIPHETILFPHDFSKGRF